MTFTIRTRSVFKYLLAGLLVSLLVLNSRALPTTVDRRSLSLAGSTPDDLEIRAPVKKVPAKKAPAKKAAAKKTPAKKAVQAKKGQAKKAAAKKGGLKNAPAGKKGAAAKGAAPLACAIKPKKKLIKRSLYPRAPLEHPSAASQITLFHGTTSRDLAKSAQKVDLSKTWDSGDFHKAGEGCDGGFYLTDSLFAAAQYVCHKLPASGAKSAYVNEYLWTPPATVKHKRYSEGGDATNALAKQDCKAYDILEGPMDNDIADANLHKEFWQYTITNQAAADHLQYVTMHKIPCEDVEKGKNVGSDLYQMGQKSDPRFAEFSKQMEKDGKCIIG